MKRPIDLIKRLNLSNHLNLVEVPAELTDLLDLLDIIDLWDQVNIFKLSHFLDSMDIFKLMDFLFNFMDLSDLTLRLFEQNTFFISFCSAL